MVILDTSIAYAEREKPRTLPRSLHPVGISLLPATIKEEILKHYQEFLGSSPSTRTHTDYSLFDSKTLDDDDRLHLEADISEGETTDAMFSINTDKAAGPDGFNSLFYRHSWEIVKEDVINAIMEFFAKGKMLKQVNSTAITLIPKIACPSSISDYRPIACCNVVYKVITKVLTNRLRRVISKLVHDNQSAFIPNRCISDNILLAHELIKDYHKGYSDELCC